MVKIVVLITQNNETKIRKMCRPVDREKDGDYFSLVSLLSLRFKSLHMRPTQQLLHLVYFLMGQSSLAFKFLIL